MCCEQVELTINDLLDYNQTPQQQAKLKLINNLILTIKDTIK